MAGFHDCGPSPFPAHSAASLPQEQLDRQQTKKATLEQLRFRHHVPINAINEVCSAKPLEQQLLYLTPVANSGTGRPTAPRSTLMLKDSSGKQRR